MSPATSEASASKRGSIRSSRRWTRRSSWRKRSTVGRHRSQRWPWPPRSRVVPRKPIAVVRIGRSYRLKSYLSRYRIEIHSRPTGPSQWAVKDRYGMLIWLLADLDRPWHPACSSRGSVRGPRRWAVAPGPGGKTTGTPAMAQRPSRSSGHGPAIALAVPGKDGVQLPDPPGALAWRSPAPPRDVGSAEAPRLPAWPTGLRDGRSFDRGRGRRI